METTEFQGFGGVRLRGSSFGSSDDPAVVLLPSAGQVRQFWHGPAAALAEAGRHAICLDLRGHGDSGHAIDARYDLDAYVADLHAVLRSLPARAVVVASGLGALIALVAVGEGGPDLVAGLILLDVNIWVDPAVVERTSGAMTRRLADYDDPDAILQGLIDLYPSEPVERVKERMLAAYARTEEGRFEWRGDPRALTMIDAVGLQDRFVAAAEAIRVPVVLVRGSLNTTITRETTVRLQTLIRGAEIAEIEGAGHYAASDLEDALNSVVLAFLERTAPRRPLELFGGSEPRLLRDALGCFGTGVTVVTTIDAAGAPIGLTANSFTSVSLDPPLILFSLLKRSANLQTFVEAGRFAVNVLHIGQQPVAGRFASRDAPRFDSVDWTVRGEGEGSPILKGSLASFDCRTYAVHDGGDHLIFIGEVTHAWFEPHRDPLLYFRGKFRRLHFA